MDSQQKEQIIAQIIHLHKDERFSDIVQLIEALPEKDYDLTVLLSLAYCSLALPGNGQVNAGSGEVDIPLLEKSVTLLESVAEEGESDPFWNERIAYALWIFPGRKADALPYARRWAALEPENPAAKEMLEDIVSSLADDAGPEMYAQEETELVEAYINQTFGSFEQVFHELVSPDIHVDICIIPPAEERNYYTLVTMGMGAHRMNVPEELAPYKLERAELLICLPPDWHLDQKSLSDERWYWPIRLLKATARLPLQCDTWVSSSHTMGLHPGETYGDSSFNGTLLLSPCMMKEEAICPLPDGDEVNFYQLIPLYPEELDYKCKYGVDALLNRLKPLSFVVDVNRPRRLAVKKAPADWLGNHKRSTYDE